ncbi:MAG TPA: magnesium/cobalt transporter CorA [Polyangiales bacterium]|nr:magnesium/cobalt transporter CorA [Polyangiales bacterium]
MEARIVDHGKLLVTQDPKEIHDALAAKKHVWVELQKKDHACDVLLGEQLQLHPLTIEDIWATLSQPKLEDYDKYLYLIIHGIGAMKAGEIDLMELDLVLGPTYVITHDPKGLVDEVRGELDRTPRLLEKGPAWLAHAILDTAVDRYLPVIDDLDHQIEDLENEVLLKAGTKKGPPILRKILSFKRMLLTLRRMSIHQREILLRLARGEFDEIPREAMPFYRDVYDHFLRVTDLVDSYRDLVSNALEGYLSVQSNRMNEIMKTLTLMSTVMLPITFIAGVYGMNFQHMPELTSPWGYPAALSLMGVIVIIAMLWFWKKGWIGSREIDVGDLDLEAPKTTTVK